MKARILAVYFSFTLFSLFCASCARMEKENPEIFLIQERQIPSYMELPDGAISPDGFRWDDAFLVKPEVKGEKVYIPSQLLKAGQTRDGYKHFFYRDHLVPGGKRVYRVRTNAPIHLVLGNGEIRPLKVEWDEEVVFQNPHFGPDPVEMEVPPELLQPMARGAYIYRHHLELTVE